MLNKLTYLTKNPHKVEEANDFFVKKYGFSIEIMSPDFEVLEIQAKSCGDVASFSAKYGAEKLGVPVLKSDSGLYIEALGGLPGPYNAYFDKQIGIETFLAMMKDIKDTASFIVSHCLAHKNCPLDTFYFARWSEWMRKLRAHSLLNIIKFYVKIQKIFWRNNV